MRIAALLLAAALAAPAQAAAPNWNGTYVWEEALGRVGGSDPKESVAIFVTYTLTIGPGGSCKLDSEGYQTFEHVTCTAVPRGTSLVVKFAGSTDSGRPLRYARGADLLTLTRAGGKLTTQLQALHDSQNHAGQGELFKKAN